MTRLGREGTEPGFISESKFIGNPLGSLSSSPPPPPHAGSGVGSGQKSTDIINRSVGIRAEGCGMRPALDELGTPNNFFHKLPSPLSTPLPPLPNYQPLLAASRNNWIRGDKRRIGPDSSNSIRIAFRIENSKIGQ